MGPYATAFRWSHSISISVCLTRKSFITKSPVQRIELIQIDRLDCWWNASI